jgi:hypothetical protein
MVDALAIVLLNAIDDGIRYFRGHRITAGLARLYPGTLALLETLSRLRCRFVEQPRVCLSHFAVEPIDRTYPASRAGPFPYR